LSGDTRTGPKLNSRSYLMSRKCAVWALLFLCIGRKGREAEAAVASLIIRWTRQQLSATRYPSWTKSATDPCGVSTQRFGWPIFFLSLLFPLFFRSLSYFRVLFSSFCGVIASAVAGRTSIRRRKLDARQCTSFMARPCVTCTQLDTETLGQFRLPP
jgi:hypothetical protein